MYTVHHFAGDVWEFILNETKYDGPAVFETIREGRKELQKLLKQMNEILIKLDEKLFFSAGDGPPINRKRIQASIYAYRLIRVKISADEGESPHIRQMAHARLQHQCATYQPLLGNATKSWSSKSKI